MEVLDIQGSAIYSGERGLRCPENGKLTINKTNVPSCCVSSMFYFPVLGDLGEGKTKNIVPLCKSTSRGYCGI